MDLTSLKNLIPEYAKDLKLNLATVLTPEGAPGLTEQQILGIALASSIAARNETLLRGIEADRLRALFPRDLGNQWMRRVRGRA